MKGALWKFLGSLRLTVVCLALSILVIFIGTIAQVDEGLYQAQARYFKQWVVWKPLLFGYQPLIPLPGGYLLGSLLVLNLIVAHTQRFSWSRRKWGIHATHLGIVTLLVGQLATDMLSRETHLRLREGESRSFTEEHRKHELVFTRDPEAGAPEMISFPEALVAEKGTIVHEKLPFELRIKNYRINSEIFSRSAILEATGQVAGALATVEAELSTTEGLLGQAEKAQESHSRLDVWRAALRAIGSQEEDPIAAVKNLDPDARNRLREEIRLRFQDQMLSAFKQQGGAMKVAVERLKSGEEMGKEPLPLEGDRGFALQAFAMPMPETRQLDEVNLPYAAVEIVQDNEPLGTWLFSPWLGPQDIVVGETTWRASFRPQRVYHPFEVELLQATHEVYLGTEIPRNFQSRVRIHHPEKGETREVDISMNIPLRYEGLTFYQYQMGEDELNENLGTSTLLVVRNPSWLAPYLGCVLVGLGMSYHFLLHLIAFIKRGSSRSRSSKATTARIT